MQKRVLKCLSVTAIIDIVRRSGWQTNLRTHSPSNSYIPVLDGLRALSIGMVLFSHLVIYDPALSWLHPIGLTLGGTGVSVFFVVSGYLITMLLLREEDRAGSVSLYNFYIRRSLRIFPAFYTFLCILAVLSLTGIITGSPVHSYLSSAIYLRNIVGQGHETAHLWSLSLEEQFYLFWPTLFILLSPGIRIRVAGIIVLGVCVWRTVLVMHGEIGVGPLYMRTDLRIDTILIGCMLALLLHGTTMTSIRQARKSRNIVPLLVFPLLIGWAYFSDQFQILRTISTIGTALLICYLVYWFLHNQQSRLAQLFQIAPMLFLGRLSYSVYLWQQLFIGPQTGSLAWLRIFPANLLLTLVVAFLSYKFIERPFLEWKDRLVRRPAHATG